MKKSAIVKLVLDLAMTAIFLSLMKIAFLGITLHELLGIGLFVLFAVHKVVNFRWIQGVCKGIKAGTATAKAKSMLVIDGVLLPVVTFMVGSGLAISQVVLPNMGVQDVATWAAYHRISSYVTLGLMSIHIGLHWQSIMQMSKKLLGMTEQAPLRTCLARLTLAAMAVWGIRACCKPELYQCLIVPTGTVQTGTATDKVSEEKNAQAVNVSLLSAAALVVDTPSLEEYLGGLFCSGCGKRCPLTALQCGRGNQYKSQAVAEYNSTYGQSEGTQPDTAEPDETQPFQQPESGRKKRPDQQPSQSIPEQAAPQDPAVNTGTGAAVTPLDYMGIMALFIGGTHYTVTFPKQRKEKQETHSAPLAQQTITHTVQLLPSSAKDTEDVGSGTDL